MLPIGTALPCRCQEAPTPVHAYLYQMVEMAIVRLFMERQIFDAIPEEGITIQQLATKTSSQFNALERFVNFFVASGVLKSPSSSYITHTSLSKRFQTERLQLLYPHMFDCFMLSSVTWTEYFDQYGMQEPQQSNRSPFGLGFGHPDKSVYEIFDLLPERTAAFNAAMALGLGEMPILGMYDFGWIGEYAKRPEASSRTLFVDIGGGLGQALRAILEEYPAIPAGQCVLEDREPVIKTVQETSGPLAAVKKVAISFFEEQPVKGALVYYIRRVLNDWTDKEVIQILSNVRKACHADSRLLISENLLPSQPPLSLAAVDVWLMNFGGKRRNERVFAEVAEQAGFKISSISKDEKTNSAVLELLPV